MWTKSFASASAGEVVQQLSGDHTPDLIFTFATNELLKSGNVFETLSSTYPDAILMGCGSGTVVSGDVLEDEGISGIAMGFEKTPIRLATCAHGDVGGSRALGDSLGAQLKADDLRAVIVLADGLTTNGSDLLVGLSEQVGRNIPISGGLAGDNAQFVETFVASGGRPIIGAVAALGFYGDAVRIANSSGGGWEEFGPVRSISWSEGNLLRTLDGRPALELYERYLGDEAADLPGSALLYPLQIWDPEDPESRVVRTILNIDREEQTMTLAGDVPEGWKARLMRSSINQLIAGAGEAAQTIQKRCREQDFQPQACLFFSCAGRRLVMKQEAEDEAIAVVEQLGANLPIAGFYSHGELGHHNVSGHSILHNETLTLTAIGEVVE